MRFPDSTSTKPAPMAKQTGKSAKPQTNGTPAAKDAPERLPAYVLSLTLENVRCFGSEQTLDLSNGKGKPAPWTIILGENGTGKTTLLQALVSFNHTMTFYAETTANQVTTTFSTYGPRISGRAEGRS